MRLKISLMLISAAALAFGAGLVSFLYIGAVNDELRETRAALEVYGERRSIPVLGRAVAAGETLTPQDFADFDLPLDLLPPNALTEWPDLAEGERLVAIQDLSEGGVLLTGMLGRRQVDDPEVRPVQLVSGMTAASLPIRNLPDLRAYLPIGARVDLFHYLPGAKPEVRLVAEALEVLGLPEAAPRTGPETAAPVVGPMPVAGRPAAATPSRPQLLLAGAHADVARALLAGQQGELHAALSAGPRAPEEGVVLVGADELAALPIAARLMPGVPEPGRPVAPPGAATAPGVLPSLEFLSSVPVAPEPPGQAAAFGMEPGRAPISGGCTTSVIRASQRVLIDVPC